MQRGTGLAAAALILIIVAPVAIQAGDQRADDRAGRQAIQFSVGDWLDIGAFQGPLISYQRFLSDTRALRIAAGLSLDLDDVEEETELGAVDEARTSELTDWEYSGTVKVQMVFYRGEDPVLLYYGLGPLVGYSDYHYEDIIYSVVGDVIHYRYTWRDGSEWRLGVQGFVGVQWTINERFALHAEYGATAQLRLGTSEYYYYRTDNPGLEEDTKSTRRSPELNSDGVRAGLSVFF